jgi:hypothetical protein
LLTNEKLIHYFTSICTDNNPNLPPYITITPTLIINKFNKPLVAQEAFQWVQKIKQYRINVQLQKMTTNQMNAINNNLNVNDNNLLGFTPTEMEGMTDIFAYLDMDAALPHSYNYLGQEQTIFTGPENETKLNNNTQKKLHDEMLKQRQNQDAQYQKQLKEIHANPSKYYNI